jgi:hypothetical protein
MCGKSLASYFAILNIFPGTTLLSKVLPQILSLGLSLVLPLVWQTAQVAPTADFRNLLKSS